MKRSTLVQLALLLIFPAFTIVAQNVTIEGAADYHDNWEVAGVTVYLIDNNTGILIDSTLTDSLGYYKFAGLPAGDYEVDIQTKAPVGGIDIIDALEVFHHLNPSAGYSFTPLQEMAADMNKDGNITHYDGMLIISHWIQTIIKGWGNNKNGFNEGEDIEFLNEFSEDGSTPPDTTGTDTTYVDSDGSKRGDVDGSYSPGVKPSDYLYIQTEGSIEASAGDIINIPVNIRETTMSSAFGIGIGFNSEALQVISASSPIDEAQVDINNNRILITWVNTHDNFRALNRNSLLLEIQAKVLPGFDQDVVSLYSTSGSLLIDETRSTKEAAFLTVPEIKVYDGIARFGEHYPNPASGNISFPLRVKDDSRISYEVYNISGNKVAYGSEGIVPKGNSIISRDISHLSPGIYYFNFRVEDLNGRKHRYSKTVIID